MLVFGHLLEFITISRRSENHKFSRGRFFFCSVLEEHDESSRMLVCTWVCALSFGRCRTSKFLLLVFVCFVGGSVRRSLEWCQPSPLVGPSPPSSVSDGRPARALSVHITSVSHGRPPTTVGTPPHQGLVPTLAPGEPIASVSDDRPARVPSVHITSVSDGRPLSSILDRHIPSGSWPAPCSRPPPRH